MDFEKVLRKRWMVRSFKPTPIPDEKIQKILRNAIRAPSAGHLQPWDFVIVKNADAKKRLARAALNQNFIEEAPVVIIACANTRRSATRYGERGIRFYSLIDTAFASLIILLTAVNEGIGASFVGAFHDEAVSKILGLPDHVRPVGIINLGYPREKPAKLNRIPLEELVHNEKW
jgi:nitroreductase